MADGKRVLIVDDHRDSGELVRILLERSGCAVRLAHDGAEALAALGDFSPQVVLLDIRLPDMTGEDIARHIRSQQAGQDIRVVAWTGYQDDKTKERCMQAGFDDFVTKPDSLDELERVLARFTR